MELQNLKKYQKIEKLLSALLIVVSVLGPLVLSVIYENKWNLMFSLLAGFCVLSTFLWVFFYRGHLSRKLQRAYDSMTIGHVLEKKSRKNQKYIITNAGYRHYYLKSLETGEQLLVTRQRVQEDFNLLI